VFYNNGAKFGGNISTDYTNIANVEIPALFFVDADEVDPIAWIAFYSGYSGVLGLSRNSSNSGVDVSSAWEWLVKEGWLDKSVFSLSFPRGGGRFGPREPGEFALGSYPEGFEKDGAIALPLKDAYGAWATTVESLRFGPNLTEEFEDGIAYFTTTNSFLSLPGDWFWSIFNATGADFRNGRYPSVDCSKRGEIPKLTLGIGGQDVVLDGYQYTVVMNATQDDCALGVGPSENGAVGLGSVFMENFLMVFDADEDSVFISERASEE
jgi:hypothetical protein